MTNEKAANMLLRLQDEKMMTTEAFEALQMGIEALEKQVPKKTGRRTLRAHEMSDLQSPDSVWNGVVAVEEGITGVIIAARKSCGGG